MLRPIGAAHLGVGWKCGGEKVTQQDRSSFSGAVPISP